MFKKADRGLVALQRQRVLVIDDDPQMRSLLVARLRSEYLVGVATNGADGLLRAHERIPDIAIIDIHMPGWDGIRTTREFRGVEEFQCVRILILTADSQRSCLTSAIAAGADDFLLKTELTPSLLLEKLRSIRRRNSPVSHNLLAARQPNVAHNLPQSHISLREGVTEPVVAGNRGSIE